MMNINRILYVIMVCLLMLASCRISDSNQVIISPNETEVFHIDYENCLGKKVELNEFWIGEGKFENISLIGSYIKVTYPQIGDYHDREIQDKINKEISTLIEDNIDLYGGEKIVKISPHPQVRNIICSSECKVVYILETMIGERHIKN